MATNEIEEIKQRLDIVELIGQYVALKKAGANYKAVCPFHQEKTPSLMVSGEKQIWKCFGCGRGGSVFDFVMEAEHLDFADALRLLAQKAGITLKAQTSAEYQSRDNKSLLYRLNRLAADYFHKILTAHPQGAKARDYLRARKVSDESVKKFQIGFAPQQDYLKGLLLKKGFTNSQINQAGLPERFRSRIIFPFFDVLGNVIGFTGRSLSGEEPKYLNTAETVLFNKSRTLFALNFAKGAIKEKDFLVLCEGQMDVIALHQNGFENAVAASGTAITAQQLQILSKYTSNFLLAFDSDKAGLDTTQKVIQMLLELDLNGKVVDLGRYKDVSELFEDNKDVWRGVSAAAKEMVDYLIDYFAQEAGELKYVENKKRVLKKILPYLAICEATRLSHYTQRLSAILSIDQQAILRALQKLKVPSAPSSTAAPVRSGTPDNEVQLLILMIDRPAIGLNFLSQLKRIEWESVQSATLAEKLEKLYNNKTLVTNPPLFFDSLKNLCGSPLAQKLDEWHFWLQNQWGGADDARIQSIIEEKLAFLKSRGYEKKKEQIAAAISQAQYQGNFKEVKELMQKLNKITREKNG